MTLFKRLSRVNWRKLSRTLVGAGVLVAVLLASPASAQDPVRIDAEIGLGGFLAPADANPVRVTLTAEVLTIGELEISLAGTRLTTPIEVPAGTTKEYELQFPPVLRGGTATVAVVNRDGRAIASTRITVRVPTEEVVAGVIGDATLVTTVDGLTTGPFEIDVVAVHLDPMALAGGLGALDYLVVGQIPDGGEAASAIARWVEQGGRLVSTAGVAAALGLPAGEGDHRVGNGAVTIHPLTSGPDGAADLTLSSVPPASFLSGSGPESQQLESTLFEAASFGATGEDLRFGWLVVALVGYVVVAGPINFFVLARINRRDWAWVTVPVLSLAGMFAFWGLGRADAGTVQVRHATVIIQDGATVDGESGLVVAGGTDGEHSLGLAAPAVLSPFDAARWFGVGGRTDTELRVDDRGNVQAWFQLASLGVGSARASWNPPPVGVSVSDGEIRNESGVTFDRWGVRTDDGFFVGDAPLGPGATARLGPINAQVPEEMFGGSPIGEALFNRPGVGFQQQDEAIWPLSWAATQIDRGRTMQGSYFFGFTTGYTVPVVADGTPQAAAGRALMIVNVGADGLAGSVTADLIAAPGAQHIEQYGPTFVYGAETVAIRYLVPDTAGAQLRLVNRGGPPVPADIKAYNWDTGALEVVGLDQAFPSGSFVSGIGEVMVQVPGGQQAEILIDAIRLEWGAA